MKFFKLIFSFIKSLFFLSISWLCLPFHLLRFCILQLWSHIYRSIICRVFFHNKFIFRTRAPKYLFIKYPADSTFFVNLRFYLFLLFPILRIKKYEFYTNFTTFNIFDYWYFITKFQFFNKFLTTKNLNNYVITQSNNSIFLKNNNIFNNNYILYGISQAWLFLKFWCVSLLLFFSILYIFLLLKFLPFLKFLFITFAVGNFVYWLLSGFVFFIKKYQFSKFNSAIQRFWRRTFIIFWILEFFLFSIFLYLTLNASTEPYYMYDQINIYKTHLFSWRYFLSKILPYLILVIYSTYLSTQLKCFSFSKLSINLLNITVILCYILWLEFYQFYHLLNFYKNQIWFFDYEEFTWLLDFEAKKTRTVNHYVTLCMVAKFWHLIFIFVFWIFFILRINEMQRARYPLYAANLQNFLFLYIMSWIYMYPWFKFVFRKQLNYYYYWFFVNPRQLNIRLFFNDLKIFKNAIFRELLYSLFFSPKSFNTFFFYYWHTTSLYNSNNLHRKTFIKDYIIFYLYKI